MQIVKALIKLSQQEQFDQGLYNLSSNLKEDDI